MKLNDGSISASCDESIAQGCECCWRIIEDPKFFEGQVWVEGKDSASIVGDNDFLYFVAVQVPNLEVFDVCISERPIAVVASGSLEAIAKTHVMLDLSRCIPDSDSIQDPVEIPD
jgi:hypothetical protein